jgi:hypothetical protein
MTPQEPSVSGTTIFGHCLRSSFTLLELSIMLQVSSIMLLENIYSSGLTHDECNDRYMLIVQATSGSVLTFAASSISEVQ